MTRCWPQLPGDVEGLVLGEGAHRVGADHASSSLQREVQELLVHYAEVTSLKGVSYRLKAADLGKVPTTTQRDHRPGRGANIRPVQRGSRFSRC